MPSETMRQAHTARMAMAYLGGKPLSSFPEGARDAIKSMAEMGEEKLKHYMHTKRRRGTVLTGGG